MDAGQDHGGVQAGAGDAVAVGAGDALGWETKRSNRPGTRGATMGDQRAVEYALQE